MPQVIFSKWQRLPVALCICAALWQASCAAARPPETTVVTPNSNAAGAPTTVTLNASDERTRRALDAWTLFVQSQNLTSATEPALQPVTATLRALPDEIAAPNASVALRLPQIISTETTSAEELEREALRRFIDSLAVPLGIETQFLSLVSIAKSDTKDAATTVSSDTRTARYTQQPFAYPLRNGYGELSVTFTGDGRIVNLRSTTIPESAALRDQVNNLRASKSAAEIVQTLVNSTLTVKDAQGVSRTLNIVKAEDVRAREIALYPSLRADGQALELHLAWEIELLNTPEGNDARLIYFDAQTGARLDS